jgi:hypothetical protein
MIMQRRINPGVQFKPVTTNESSIAVLNTVVAPPASPKVTLAATPSKVVPTLMDDEDSDGEQDPASVFAQTACDLASVASLPASLPPLSDDDDEEASGAASATLRAKKSSTAKNASKAPNAPNAPKAPKASKAPKAPKALKVPQTEEEKVERKRLKEEERAEKKRKGTIEARLQLRMEAGALRADALSVMDGKVPVGERWVEVDESTRLKRAKLVPGALDVIIQRKILGQNDYLPPGFVHDDIGHTVYVHSTPAKTAAEERREFLDAAGRVKWHRVGLAQKKLAAYMASKQAAAAATGSA